MEPYQSMQDEQSFFLSMSMWAAASPELPFDLIGAAPELPGLPNRPPAVPSRRSAFQKYLAGQDFAPVGALPRPGFHGSGGGGGGGGKNVHERMTLFLGRIGQEKEASKGAESSRGFRHMMRERQRREKLSQSYADLYAILACRSKGDKNSIVQSAAVHVRELKNARDELQRRHEELKAQILGRDARQEGIKVKFEADEPPSSIDSMIGALRCLKSMDVKARSVHSDMSGRRLSAVLTVETTIATSEVEKAVEAALKEAERKPHQPFPGTKGLTHITHVGNVF